MLKPDLKEWLSDNRDTFITFTVEEIAARALVAGYSQGEVDNWITEVKWDRRVA